MTRFSGLSRPAAWCILAGLLGTIAWGVIVSQGLPTWALGAHRGADDLEFYRQIVTRIHQGDSYYDAFNGVCTESGLSMTSTFHCRLPTCAWLIGSSPAPDLCRWLLVLLSLLAVIAAVQTFLAPVCGSFGQLFGALFLMGGAFSWSIYEQDAFLATEPWCEVLILFSLVAYARGRWQLGMAAALGALALRELAGPYCLVAGVLAAWRGRRTEWLLWIAFLGLYAFLLHLHGQEVARHFPSVQGSSVNNWLHDTGLGFVLQSCVMNVFLRGLPNWLIAVYMPVALIGLIGWPGEIGVRLALSAAIYVVAFSVIRGTEYWGYMYSSVLVLGAVRSPAVLRDLVQAALGSRRVAASSSRLADG